MIIIFLMLPFLSFSQKEGEFYLSLDKASLSSAFEKIERIYNVKFSYQDDNIAGKVITLKEEKRTLNELLDAIEKKFELDFSFITNRYIVISKKKKDSSIEELDKVIIKSYLTEGISKNIDGSYKINPLRLGILPGLTEPDVLESIQLLPGVVSPNETASGFLVRGGKMDQNRLMWDGITMYHKGHLFGMISPFNTNATKNVTFVNKGSNPRYGERLSSVIAMTTTTAIPDKFKMQLGLNGISGDAYFEIPLIKNKFAIQASVRSSYADLYQSVTVERLADKVFESTKIESGNNPNNSFDFLDYNIKLNYKPNSSNTIYASLISIDNQLDYAVVNTESNETFKDLLVTKNSGYSLGWDKVWNANIRQHTVAYFSDYRLNYNFITAEDGQQLSNFEKRNIVFDSGISTELNWEINSNKAVNFGYQYTLKDVAYAFLNTTNVQFILDEDKAVVQSHSLYGNYTYKNSNLFDIEIGGRASYFKELQALRLEPRILLYKTLFKNLKLQVSGEIKNQIISQIDETIISDLSLENRIWRLANDDSPIIKGKQVSAGFIYTNKGWTIDIDNYYKVLTDITALSLGFLNPENGNFNLGEQEIYGVDLFLKKRFIGLNTWLSYSINTAKSRYDSLNDDRYFTSRSNVRHAFSSSLSYEIGDFMLALGWRWQTGKPYTESTSEGDDLKFINGINTKRLPNYKRLDFSSTYKFKFSKNNKLRAKVGLSIRNVFDENNFISREYRGNNDINGTIETIDKFSIGFTPNLMFRLYW